MNNLFVAEDGLFVKRISFVGIVNCRIGLSPNPPFPRVNLIIESRPTSGGINFVSILLSALRLARRSASEVGSLGEG
jgi:hypothetical protein